jgi:hypothetical protein
VKVNHVLKWVIAGGTEQDIREAVAHHFPGDDPHELLGAVMLGLINASNFDRDVITGWCVEAYRDLYRRMVDAADYAGALRAVKLLADLARDHVPSPREEEDDEDRDPAEGRGLREEETGTGPARLEGKPGAP